MAATPLTILVLLFAARLSTELELGGDYSSQRYWSGIYDTLEPGLDTLDVETEARVALNLDLDAGPGFSARNQLAFSNRSVRDRLELNLDREIASRLSLQAGNETELKHYHDLAATTDTLYRTDHLANSTSLRLEFKPGIELAFSAWDRVQLYHYPEPDSYTYDYLLNQLGVGLRRGFGIVSEVRLDYTWTRRVAGEESYDGHDLAAGLDWFLDAGPVIELTGDLGRRGYADRAWSYREVGAGLSFNNDLGDHFAIDIANESRLTLYDTATIAHQDVAENSAQLSFEARPGTDLVLRAGPRYELGRGIGGPNDEDYRELALLAGIDYTVPGRLWLSLEDRLGRRRYLNADTALQTDYLFNEINLFLNWTALDTRAGALVLDAMVSISPEWHDRATDNFSTRIYTLGLKYRF